ncbi:MAG: hypothetical protein AABX49_00465, partial [Nanoarchaeota archaeon]
YISGKIYISNHSEYVTQYLLKNRFISKDLEEANYIYLDNVLTLYEQLLFTHPDGNIIKDNHAKDTLDSLFDWCVMNNDYPHLTWTFEVLTNYPEIDQDYINEKKNKVMGLLRNDITDISLTHLLTSYDYNYASPEYPEGYLIRAKAKLFQMTARKFGLFDSMKARNLLAIFLKKDEVNAWDYRCPMTDKFLHAVSWSGKIDIGYREGTTLEHFLKDIGIGDPMMWWKSLE